MRRRIGLARLRRPTAPDGTKNTNKQTNQKKKTHTKQKKHPHPQKKKTDQSARGLSRGGADRDPARRGTAKKKKPNTQHPTPHLPTPPPPPPPPPASAMRPDLAPEGHVDLSGSNHAQAGVEIIDVQAKSTCIPHGRGWGAAHRPGQHGSYQDRRNLDRSGSSHSAGLGVNGRA